MSTHDVRGATCLMPLQVRTARYIPQTGATCFSLNIDAKASNLPAGTRKRRGFCPPSAGASFGTQSCGILVAPKKVRK